MSALWVLDATGYPFPRVWVDIGRRVPVSPIRTRRPHPFQKAVCLLACARSICPNVTRMDWLRIVDRPFSALSPCPAPSCRRLPRRATVGVRAVCPLAHSVSDVSCESPGGLARCSHGATTDAIGGTRGWPLRMLASLLPTVKVSGAGMRSVEQGLHENDDDADGS